MIKLRQRRGYCAELKAKVALEAIRGRKTVNQIASEYDVHPNQVGTWKKQALQSLPEVFSGSGVRSWEDEQACNRRSRIEPVGDFKVAAENRIRSRGLPPRQQYYDMKKPIRGVCRYKRDSYRVLWPGPPGLSNPKSTISPHLMVKTW